MKTPTDTTDLTFSDLMNQRGITLSELATGMGQYPSNILGVVHGERSPRTRGYKGNLGELVMLARFFDLSPDQIKDISRTTVARRNSDETPERTEL